MINKSYKRKIQYHETDQMGIVHHSNYIKWFEEARTDGTEQIGFGYDKMEEENILIPVLTMYADYKSACKYGEEVEVYHRYRDFSGVRFKVEYEVRDSETDELRATGVSTHAILDQDMRPLRLKKTHPEFYAKLMPLFSEDEEGNEQNE